MSKSKKRPSGRPGKTPTELLLRRQVDTLMKINDGLAKAKKALDNEASEVLEELVRMTETQQDQIIELSERLDRLEGKENDDGSTKEEEFSEELAKEGSGISGEE